MADDTDTLHRTHSGNEPENHTSRPSAPTSFPHSAEEDLMVVEDVNSSQPGQETVADGAARPNGTEMVPQENGEPARSLEVVLLSPDPEIGLRQASVPCFVRRRLSRAAYALHETLRWQELGSEVITTYEQLITISGYHSKTTISNALRQLESLGVIWTQVVRVDGRVSGLRILYLGFPIAIPEEARKSYIERAMHEIENLSGRIEVRRREIRHLERIADIQNSNTGEAA